MNPALQGKVAIVMGGTGALRRAVSKELASSNAKFSIPSIVDEEVTLFEKELGSLMGQGTTRQGGHVQPERSSKICE